MMNSESKKGPPKRRLSTLILIVLFIFLILLVSVSVATGISYILIRIGLLPALTTSRFPAAFIFLSIVNLFLCTVIASVGGDKLLKPLRRLIEATKEVAAGNFNVQVEVSGTHELARLAASFNEMAKELGSVETLRSDFVSNISHEFKTPVVSIRGFARRLKKDGLTDEKRNEYLDIIISETEHLTQLSSNVLLLSNLEATDKVVEKTAYRLDEQIRRSILLIEPHLEHKRLEIQIDLEPAQIVAGEEMMRHVWTNLLGNAIKFSPEGGTVGVLLRADEDKAVVSVSDMGIGMDDEVKLHIFDKFYQSDKSRSTAGNGLGLSLVKRILELSDGDIVVDSAPGEGTCFTVSLPING